MVDPITSTQQPLQQTQESHKATGWDLFFQNSKSKTKLSPAERKKLARLGADGNEWTANNKKLFYRGMVDHLSHLIRRDLRKAKERARKIKEEIQK